jgi:hypothetical protein
MVSEVSPIELGSVAFGSMAALYVMVRDVHLMVLRKQIEGGRGRDWVLNILSKGAPPVT